MLKDTINFITLKHYFNFVLKIKAYVHFDLKIRNRLFDNLINHFFNF